MAFTQLDDLSMLNALSENLSKNESETADEIISVKQDDNRQDARKENTTFSDEEYGYTGGRNFKNPPQTKFSDQVLEYFGYDYFLDQPTTFINIPIPPDYLIGPDDNIQIVLYGNKNKKYELKVTRDGDIFIPEIGPLYVAGVTFKNLQQLVEQTVSSQLIGTQVNTTLGSLRSIDVFILGAANKPGMYSISALSTLTNAIIKTGGIDISGSLRNIKLKRNGNVVENFDFYDLLLSGDTNSDSRLMQGDVIFIEPIGKTAAINGEVNRPGIYELKDKEDLGDLLKFAGNLKPKANFLSADLIRINSITNSFELMSLNLKNAMNSGFAIESGDVVSVHPVPNNLNRAILLSGHAQQPGFYPWKEGMRISSLFDNTNDLLGMTDLNYVLVKRRNLKSQDYQFLQVDLEKLFNNLESEENITLYDQDEIVLMPSLLSPELITTKIIQDKYLIDQETNQVVLQDQWTSLTYLTKSLTENKDNDPGEIQSSIIEDGSSLNQNDASLGSKRFYEYSIYDYCIIPQDFASEIIRLKGFAKTESIAVKELNKISTSMELESLLKNLEFEEELEIEKNTENLNINITNYCRRQLIDPMISILKSQGGPLERQKIIKTFGNVLYPGEYPHTNNMDISDAIAASGGLMDSTYASDIEVSRRNIQNKEYVMTTENFSISSIVSPGNSIEAMDEINVKKLSKDFRTAEITGQVYFPGVYPIFQGETLKDLIIRAGGIKDGASFEGAIFTRDSLRKSDTRRLKEAQADLRRKILLASSQNQISSQNQQGNSGFSDLLKLLTFEQQDNELLGRLVIDLEPLMDDRSQEVLLEDGDKLHIPRLQQMVTVVGEVNGSNSHQYDSQLSISDYIELSGGFTTFGDTSNIYVVKSNGSTFTFSNDGGFFRSSKLEAGDTIVIPFQADKFSSLRATTEITQIVYQMALAAAAVNSF